jgi:hypothetical protein
MNDDWKCGELTRGTIQFGIVDRDDAQAVDPKVKKTADIEDKAGLTRMNFATLTRLIVVYMKENYRFPKNLAELEKPLPKDVYGQRGDDYHYEPIRGGYILSSYGEDGIYGNNDDETNLSGVSFRLRRRRPSAGLEASIAVRP